MCSHVFTRGQAKSFGTKDRPTLEEHMTPSTLSIHERLIMSGGLYSFYSDKQSSAQCLPQCQGIPGIRRKDLPENDGLSQKTKKMQFFAVLCKAMTASTMTALTLNIVVLSYSAKPAV